MEKIRDTAGETTAAAPSDPRLASYRSYAGRYDELVADDGRIRGHWRALIRGVSEDDARAARRATEFTRRMIVENGVTYNVYADEQGRDRPWILDPLPYLLTAQEWRTIEVGVAQRARLLNAVLATSTAGRSCYRRVRCPPRSRSVTRISSGPAAASVRARIDGCGSTASTSRAPPTDAGGCSPIAPKRPRARVMRSKTARSCGAPCPNWRNRWMCARWARSSPRCATNCCAAPARMPLAVVLTPGSFNETYFEHAYLARQLGFPLVEGHDLTVRDETVFLKTLAGLKRVHAVFCAAR